MYSFKDDYYFDFADSPIDNPTNFGGSLVDYDELATNFVSVYGAVGLKNDYFDYTMMGWYPSFEATGEVLLYACDWDGWHTSYMVKNPAALCYFSVKEGEWMNGFKMDVLPATQPITAPRDYFDGAHYPFLYPVGMENEIAFPFLENREKLFSGFTLSVQMQQIMQKVLISKLKEGLLYNAANGDGVLYVNSNVRYVTTRSEVPYSLSQYYDQHELDYDEDYMYRVPLLNSVDKARLDPSDEEHAGIIANMKLLGWWDLTDAEIEIFKNWSLFDGDLVDYKHSLIAIALGMPVGDVRIACKNAANKVVGWFTYFQRYDGNSNYRVVEDYPWIDTDGNPRLIFIKEYGHWYNDAQEEATGEIDNAWPGQNNVPAIQYDVIDESYYDCIKAFGLTLTTLPGAAIGNSGSNRFIRYRKSDGSADPSGATLSIAAQLRGYDGENISPEDLRSDIMKMNWYWTDNQGIYGDENKIPINVLDAPVTVSSEGNNMTVEYLGDGLFNISVSVDSDIEFLEVVGIVKNTFTGNACATVRVTKTTFAYSINGYSGYFISMYVF